jgi:phosphate transport system protein
MFEKFKELFSSENLLDAAYDTTLTMLEFDYKMYDASRRTLRESDSDELPFDIRRTDRKINKYEREVRRNVLTHLTVAGTHNLVPGLVLVSIVIDVERIGDYTKNISELARKHKNMLKGGMFEDELAGIEAAIEENFPRTIEVLKTQDNQKARQVMQAEDDIGRTSDKMLDEIILEKDTSLSVGDAVTLAMYVRHLKRINAHLTNIASSIINPFPRIGFREKEENGDQD